MGPGLYSPIYANEIGGSMLEKAKNHFNSTSISGKDTDLSNTKGALNITSINNGSDFDLNKFSRNSFGS